jgi:chemotaxis protein CheD
MSRRPVQFGLGDLGTRLAGLLADETPSSSPADDGEGPPAGPMTFVHTGEVAVSRERTLYSTVLGSCVSICVWDPVTGAGGMNHFLLPDQVTNGISSPRFGNVAVRTLLSRLQAIDVPAARLQAKIFGGASVLQPGIPMREALGARNVELARVLLELAGIPVVAEDVGGDHGRKLIFRTRDGAAWVRRL